MSHPIQGVKRVLVCGAGGFIGSHLVTALKNLGYTVAGVDLKYPEFSTTDADKFYIADLTQQSLVQHVFANFQPEHVYQLAADMGGADYIFSGLNDANVFYNSGQINFNIVSACVKHNVKRVFYSSSACIYPESKQTYSYALALKESDAYPAGPDSEYGWEKLLSERLYMSFERNHGLEVRIARFHNIFGPYGTWKGGKEKAPAAFCRKVAQASISYNKTVEVYGDGEQTRSFLYIDECVEGILRLMESNYNQPLNIGSGFQVSINQLAHLIANQEGVTITLDHAATDVQGVRGRGSNNDLIREVLGWAPGEQLGAGLVPTYKWIKEQLLAGLESGTTTGNSHGVEVR